MRWQARHYRIDREHSNAHALWQAWVGRCRLTTISWPILTARMGLERLEPDWALPAGPVTLQTVLPAQAVVARRSVHIEPIRPPPLAPPRISRWPPHDSACGPSRPIGRSASVFMHVDVRAVQDTNGDGIGDLPGLIARLDHFEQVGIGALFLGCAAAVRLRLLRHDGNRSSTASILAWARWPTSISWSQPAHARGIAVLISWSPSRRTPLIPLPSVARPGAPRPSGLRRLLPVDRRSSTAASRAAWAIGNGMPCAAPTITPSG